MAGKGTKRPCSVCRRWFTPSARVRHCQRTCGQEECKREQKRRTQQLWSKKNPDYWSGYRLTKKLEAVKEGEEVAELRGPPSELRRLPAEVVQEAIGPQGVVIMGEFGRVLHSSAQEAISRQLAVLKAEIAGIPRPAPQEALVRGVL